MSKPTPIIDNINGHELYFEMTLRLYYSKGITYVQKWNEEKDRYEFLYGSYLSRDIIQYINTHFPHYGWIKTFEAYRQRYDGGICFEQKGNENEQML